MPRHREPKTIEEAAEFLAGLLPVGWHLHVSVYFYAHHSEGRRSSSRDCTVHFWPDRDRDAGFDVKASSPGDLCKLALRQIAEKQGPPVIEAPRPRRLACTQLRLTGG